MEIESVSDENTSGAVFMQDDEFSNLPVADIQPHSSHGENGRVSFSAELHALIPTDRISSQYKRKSPYVEYVSGKRQARSVTPFESDGMQLSDEESAEAHAWVASFQRMSLSVQQTALENLLSECPSHIRYLAAMIEPHFQRDFLSLLPPEIALHIVSMLPAAMVVRAARTCKRWQMLCDDEQLWRRKCEMEGIAPLPDPTLRFKGLWTMPNVALHRTVTIVEGIGPAEVEEYRRRRRTTHGPCYVRSPHKSLFLRTAQLYNNWAKRPIAGCCFLKGHEDHVITCLQLQDDMVVTGSDDNTLKVWSVDNSDCQEAPHLKFTLSGHTGGVWTSSVSRDGKYIVSGSTDRTVRVWDARTGEQLHVLAGHTSTVRCMCLVGHTLVSGSRDTTLRIWDIENGRCLSNLFGHVAAVRCVQFDGRRVVSGAYDFTVKVWEAATGECVHTLQGHTNRVYSLLLDAPRDLVVSGSLDTTIRVWNIETGQCVAHLVGHTSLTSGMQLRGDLLVSCNADSYVRVWNIREGTCVFRLGGQPFGHLSAITSLQLLSNGLVATSSDDGTVKLWDVHRGLFVRDLVRLSTGGSGGCIWRLKSNDTLLVCAVGSRNGTEDTKLILIDFDASYP